MAFSMRPVQMRGLFLQLVSGVRPRFSEIKHRVFYQQSLDRCCASCYGGVWTRGAAIFEPWRNSNDFGSGGGSVKKMIAVLVLIIAVAITAQAQATKPVSIYLGAGVSPLSGDYSSLSLWNTGFHGLAGVGFNVSPEFQIGPKLEYHSFGLDKHGMDVSGGTLSSFMIGGDARYEFAVSNSPIKPMILGGLGIAKVSLSDFSGGGVLVPGANESKVYFEFGGGITFKAGPSAKLFVTVRYTSVALEGTSMNYIPITFGVIF